jgi:hypothetical protein
VQDFQKEWQISTKFDVKVKTFDTEVVECKAKLLCGTYDNSDAIKEEF